MCCQLLYTDLDHTVQVARVRASGLLDIRTLLLRKTALQENPQNTHVWTAYTLIHSFLCDT